MSSTCLARTPPSFVMLTQEHLTPGRIRFPKLPSLSSKRGQILLGTKKIRGDVFPPLLVFPTNSHQDVFVLKSPPSEGPREGYYYMEQVLLPDLIIDEFYKESRKRNKTIPIMGDQRKKGHKYTRIESLLEPLHRNSKLYLNAAEKDNPHMRRLEEQFRAFAPGSRAHDDAPEAVEGAIWIINNKEIIKKSGTITIIKRRPSSKHF